MAREFVRPSQIVEIYMDGNRQVLADRVYPLPPREPGLLSRAFGAVASIIRTPAPAIEPDSILQARQHLSAIGFEAKQIALFDTAFLKAREDTLYYIRQTHDYYKKPCIFDYNDRYHLGVHVNDARLPLADILRLRDEFFAGLETARLDKANPGLFFAGSDAPAVRQTRPLILHRAHSEHKF